MYILAYLKKIQFFIHTWIYSEFLHPKLFFDDKLLKFERRIFCVCPETLATLSQTL